MIYRSVFLYCALYYSILWVLWVKKKKKKLFVSVSISFRRLEFQTWSNPASHRLPCLLVTATHTFLYSLSYSLNEWLKKQQIIATQWNTPVYPAFMLRCNTTITIFTIQCLQNCITPAAATTNLKASVFY